MYLEKKLLNDLQVMRLPQPMLTYAYLYLVENLGKRRVFFSCPEGSKDLLERTMNSYSNRWIVYISIITLFRHLGWDDTFLFLLFSISYLWTFMFYMNKYFKFYDSISSKKRFSFKIGKLNIPQVHPKLVYLKKVHMVVLL